MVSEAFKSEAFEMVVKQLPTLLLTTFASAACLLNIVVEKGAKLIINNKSITI